MARYALFLALLLNPEVSGAQLTDRTQTTPSIPGGQIAKSLEEQVDAGHGDALTPGSAVYLIKRDPARAIRRGRQLFQRKFTASQGLGPRVNGDANGNIREQRALGAGLSDSCAGCHGRPRGAAGFGGDVATRPDSRDAPHLFGLGLKEMLADEMTRELRAVADEAIARAQRRGREVSLPLRAKGISFGQVSGRPDGGIDASLAEGVDADLRVKPFFLHGETASIREFTIGAFKAEMGLEAFDPVLCTATDPEAPAPATSPSGFVFDPALDRFERPPVCDAALDPDGDGVRAEIDPALVDHLEFYLLNYFKPGIDRRTRRSRRGAALMEEIGCNDCHVPSLRIEQDRRVADVETRYDPRRGIFNRLFAEAATRFVVHDDGESFPQLLPSESPFEVKDFYSDLKRHDLGPAFWEREYDGSLRKEFLTTPLWGVGSTGPYGHDGRSTNLRNVILRHGGEARRASARFTSLRDSDQRKILEFLQTLVLFPPDDTASNLNPGDPRSRNVQDPAVHGNINLGALFQIDPADPE